jgi:hypothetical protein
MGWCSVGSRGESCDLATCNEIHGEYKNEPGGCLLLSVLQDERAILMASTLMYPAIMQFRDEVLRTTPIGTRMLGYFDRFYDEAISIAQSDPELVTDIVWTMTYGSPFIRAMLGEDLSAGRYGQTPTSYLAERLRPQTVESLVSLIRRFRQAASTEFVEALNDFETAAMRFVNLTPQEALVELRRDGQLVDTRG